VSFYLIMTLCHYVSRITHERGNGCRPNIVGTDKARTREVINFWWWSGSACAFRITFSFFYHCAVCDFRRFISISHTITGRFLMKLGVTWLMPTREWIHNILFFFLMMMMMMMMMTDPADIRIQIRINRKSGFESRMIFSRWWSLRSLAALMIMIIIIRYLGTFFIFIQRNAVKLLRLVWRTMCSDWTRSGSLWSLFSVML